MGYVIRVCEDILRKSAVLGIPAELRFGANGLPTG
jgi:hypothetical protein